MKNLNNNILWSFLSQFSNFGFSLIFMVILARKILPAEYGVVGQAQTVTAFFTVFAEGGIVWSIVRQKVIKNEQITNLFWINVIIGIFLFVICLMISPVVGKFYGNFEAGEVFSVLGVIYLLTGVTVPHQMWLKRNLAFKKITLINIFAVIIAGVSALTAVYNGCGLWSIVVQGLTKPLIEMLLLIFFSKMPMGFYKFDIPIKQMLKFGSGLIGFGLVNYFARNLDNILIGKLCGVKELAFYTKAYFVMFLPTMLVAGALSGVMVSVLSKVQDDKEKFQKLYSRVLRMVFVLTFPLTGYYLVFPEDVIIILYGENWMDSVGLLKMLGVAAITQPLYYTIGWVYTAIGKSKEMFVWGVVASVILSISFFIGVQWGEVGVAITYSLINGIVLFVVGMYVPHKLADMNLVTSLKPLIFILIAGIVAFSITKIASYYVVLENTYFDIIIRVLCVITVYVFVLYARYKKNLLQLIIIEKGL